jgi:hypothetical protein
MRTLIVLVLIVGAGLGLIVHNAKVQRDAVAAIEAAGGNVWYDWEYQNGKPIPNGQPPWPKWLIDRVGMDYFGHVASVSLQTDGFKASNAVLAHVGRLSQLEELNVMGSKQVTNAGLIHLKGLSRLKRLYLGNTGISDAGLVHLKGLTNLEDLGLRYTRVSDDGLAHLEGLTRLQKLTLGGNPITDSGLVHLRQMTDLRMLGLRNTAVTDEGLAHLRLPHLTELDLGGTRITGAGAEHLGKFTGLRRLVLREMPITDADITPLSALTGLESLDLTQTRITFRGLGEMAKALPGTRIIPPMPGASP